MRNPLFSNLATFFEHAAQKSEQRQAVRTQKQETKTQQKEQGYQGALRSIAYFIGCQYADDYDNARELLDDAEEEGMIPKEVLDLCRRDREIMRLLQQGLEDGEEEDYSEEDYSDEDYYEGFSDDNDDDYDYDEEDAYEYSETDDDDYEFDLDEDDDDMIRHSSNFNPLTM